tara:strand:+ start:6551 stop:6820 length:270 start_codon:yes stop_codon:yes gene_type:complete
MCEESTNFSIGTALTGNVTLTWPEHGDEGDTAYVHQIQAFIYQILTATMLSYSMHHPSFPSQHHVLKATKFTAYPQASISASTHVAAGP